MIILGQLEELSKEPKKKHRGKFLLFHDYVLDRLKTKPAVQNELVD